MPRPHCFPRPRPAKASGRGGFTLIEILLAIGILAIGCSAVLFLFTLGARAHRRAVDRTRAALLAEAVFNQVRADLAGPQGAWPSRYPLDPDDPTQIQPIENATHASFPEFTYDLTFTPLYEGDYYIVTLRVWWGDKSRAEAQAAPDQYSERFEFIVRRKNF